jgi:hypothetical protein
MSQQRRQRFKGGRRSKLKKKAKNQLVNKIQEMKLLPF